MGVDKRSIVRRQAIPTTVSQPVVTPIFPSVVYRSTDADELEAVYEGRLSGYTYSREGHPNAAVLTDKIGWLEGMTQSMGHGVVTGSGMGAISTAFLGLLQCGDHIVASVLDRRLVKRVEEACRNRRIVSVRIVPIGLDHGEGSFGIAKKIAWLFRAFVEAAYKGFGPSLTSSSSFAPPRDIARTS